MHEYIQAGVPNVALKTKLHFTGDTDGKPILGARNASTCKLEWKDCTYMCRRVCVCVCAEKNIKPEN